MDLEELARVMADMRPRVHRYCARMVGSAFDGEDVVQDAFARAAEAWPVVGDIANPEGWLLRIAHNVALDALRRRRRQGEGAMSPVADTADDSAHADARVAAAASLSMFLHLPTLQRSVVVLVDVLGHAAAETAAILGVSVAGVKAALHRGRLRLRELSDADGHGPPRLAEADRCRLQAYADRFNARDFDALRDLLSEEVRLDLPNRTRLAGRTKVSLYFTRYGESPDCRIYLGWSEGRAVLLLEDPRIGLPYIVLLDWADEQIGSIRDFRFALYVMDGLMVERF